MDEQAIASIHKQYGDHLYLKGNYDEAINQFVKTLGHVQPSYVIRKVRETRIVYTVSSDSVGPHRACGDASF